MADLIKLLVEEELTTTVAPEMGDPSAAFNVPVVLATVSPDDELLEEELPHWTNPMIKKANVKVRKFL